MADLVTRAKIQIQQLTEESPQNRAGIKSAAEAQRLVLERLFDGYPEVWKEIQGSPEWEQPGQNSPLHHEQFEELVRRYAKQVEGENVV